MYYHCRPLKYVEYGKVFPHTDDDNFLNHAYRWLGRYCGYCPQIWLSRSSIRMTGVKNTTVRKGGPFASAENRRSMREREDSILFGFDVIRGFPIDYAFWCTCIIPQNPARFARPDDVIKATVAYMDDLVAMAKEDDGPAFIAGGNYAMLVAWDRCRPDFDAFLKSYAFVERGQVVVPSLNLKSAKVVICRDERQKKALRRMGFIEDRIEIRKLGR